MATLTNLKSRFLLLVLTWQLRVITVDQLQRMLDAQFEPPGSATRIVRQLVRQGLLSSARTAATFVEATTPICTWPTGQPARDFASIAWELEKRWRHARPRTVMICCSTRQAAQLLGGLASFRQHAGQLEHDLGTASVLAALYETSPASAEKWIGEDILRRDLAGRERCLKKIPDGAIVANDKITKVIEFGGQYPARRLRCFHQHCARYRVPYDIY